MSYERLLLAAQGMNIEIYETSIRGNIKGLYQDGIVWINNNISTNTEKLCILAEELGHYHTTSGNILNQSDLQNRKQELRARQWAYQCLIPLEEIVQASYKNVSGRHELAEYLGVTDQFLQEAIDRYTEKYGLSVRVDDKHTIYFEPLYVAIE